MASCGGETCLETGGEVVEKCGGSAGGRKRRETVGEAPQVAVVRTPRCCYSNRMEKPDVDEY